EEDVGTVTSQLHIAPSRRSWRGELDDASCRLARQNDGRVEEQRGHRRRGSADVGTRLVDATGGASLVESKGSGGVAATARPDRIGNGHAAPGAAYGRQGSAVIGVDAPGSRPWRGGHGQGCGRGPRGDGNRVQ